LEPVHALAIALFAICLLGTLYLTMIRRTEPD